MIYLDNASTSFPKPAECLRRALELYLEKGASPGRGGYDLAVEAEELVNAARRRLCRFFEGDDSYHLCFAHNATDTLNVLIRGLVDPGSHVVSSRLEHNSVLRPLHHLRRQGVITFHLVPFNEKGFIDPILALDSCLDYLERSHTVSYEREMSLLEKLRDGLERSPRLQTYCIHDLDNHLPLLTCTVDGIGSEDVGAILDGDFGIAVRAGLHCAPLVHQDLGTFEKGAVRFSLGVFTSEAEIDEAIRAMTAVAG